MTNASEEFLVHWYGTTLLHAYLISTIKEWNQLVLLDRFADFLPLFQGWVHSEKGDEKQ